MQGDYAAAKPLLEQALAISKAVLGERHPDTATSLNNLALLLEAQGDYAAAKPLFEQAMDICRHNLDLAADAETERQQMAMADMLRFHLDAFLSAAPRVGIADGVSYRQVLAWKGAILERQRRLRDLRRLLRADPRPEVARAAAEWQSTVVRLATLALAQPGPNQQDAWRRQLADLTERKDQLEEELTRQQRRVLRRAGRGPAHPRATPGRPAPRCRADRRARIHPLQPAPRTQGQAEVRASPDRVRGPARSADRAGGAGAAGADPDGDRRLAADPEAREAGAPGRARRPGGAAAAAGLEPLGRASGGGGDGAGLARRGAGPGAAGGPAGQGGGLLPDRGLHARPGPRAPAVRRRRGGRGGRPEAGAWRGPRCRRCCWSATSITAATPAQDPTAARAGRPPSATLAGLLPDFPKLPATGDEIASIGRDFKLHFQGAQPDKLFGDLATEAALREAASKHRFLHLATHGYFAPEALKSALGRTPGAGRPGELFGGLSVSGYHPGLLSGLVLTGANVRPTPLGKDDGILTALEVAELDLSGVELAVLSACETGLGDVAGGEGLLGLQRAFQVAGAKSVVASLWTVSDEPTRALMARFYENLWRKGLTPRAAIREAQLYMLREGLRRGVGGIRRDEKDASKSDRMPRGVGGIRRDEKEAPKSDRMPPFYWAAFVLSTDRL